VSKRVLERYGYEVVVAVDGAHALELWRADPTRFDLIMSDLVMPNVGGAELARALSRQSDPPKILLVSGYSGTEMAQRNVLDPAIPLLQKPWAVADLLRHVRELLDS
jgi:CheY-like chemotaxis protein